MNKKSFRASCLFFLLVFSGLSLWIFPETPGQTRPVSVKKLAQQYRDWLDLVSYIITPTEKEVFLHLTSDRERDAFINLFWNLRDPSKGTPQNEYKDEHLKRVQYANQYFKYGAPGPGWKTDRGRIYILLGPPMSTNEIDENGIRPVEIWDYLGGPSKGLPTAFRIAFFKPSGTGDYKLYIPAVDGPFSLLTGPDNQIDPVNYGAIYEKIRNIEPAVADIALSLIPGETQMSLSPSLHDSLLIAKIYDLPKSNINATYARNFSKYKGIVNVSVSTNYIDLTSKLTILKDPRLDLNFVHLALEPERFTVEELNEDKLYFSFKLTITLKKGDDFILQYDKDFPVYFTKAEVENTISQGIIIADLIPVIDGEYTLTAVLRNSVSDEISYLEKTVKVSDSEGGRPKLYEPILSYGTSPGQSQGYAPFRIMNQSIKIDPKMTFGASDSLSSFFFIERGSHQGELRLKVHIESLDPSKPLSKESSLSFPQDNPHPFFSIALDPLPYGNYSLKSFLVDQNDAVLDSKENIFQIALNSQVPHPALISKILKDEDRFVFYYMAATEYDEINLLPQAAIFYEKALSLNRTNPDLIKKYADFLLRQGRYDDLLSVIENLKTQDKEAFSYHGLKGRALFAKKEYNAAVESLLEANKIYDSDTIILNTLGFALIRIGEKDEAMKVLSASLRLKKDQKDIQKILLELEKERNHGKKR